MRKQKESDNSDSQKRVNKIFQEEQALSKAFQISNFYTNQRLNIIELKQRLEQFKKTQKQQPGSKQYETPQKRNLALFNQTISAEVDKEIVEEHSTAKFANNSQRNPVDFIQAKQFIKKNIEARPKAISNVQKGLSIERKEQARQANYRIIKQVHKSRYEPKIKTAYGSRNSDSINQSIIHNRLNKKKNSIQKTEQSKYSDSSHRRSWSQLGYQGRIKVQTTQYLNQLQKYIHNLWQHYQLLTKILLGLREENRQQKNAIVKYVEDICSDKFEFIRELLNIIQKQNPSKSQSSYLKRMRKAIIQSKLYQNLSLVYVSLDICLKMQPDSHLVNFVGYCSSNVIFLLKFLTLSHQLASNLSYSTHTQNILAVISQFQQQSYKIRIERMGDLILRIEHNNQIIGIVQQRICNKMAKQFQQIIVTFLKNVDMQTKPLYEYAHYIYQFLAFHLARLNIIGQFSFVEMAPTPYLNLPMQKTLVIEPWEVIFALRGQNTYIRAYSQAFLMEVAKHWNIVYWTDLMPDQIDDLIEKLPPGNILYRYHCRYENERFLKLIWRIGCDIDNTIIFDRQQTNFKYDREIGVSIPWNGKSKDSKLLQVLNFVRPLLSAPTIPLRKGFQSVKEQILNESKKSRNKNRDRSIESRNESLLPRQLRK